MAVIFFDGFNREINTNHWTATNATHSTNVISIASSNPVANNLRLSNIGTHSSKKLYLGLRLSSYYADDNQPFITFYNSSNSAVLQLTWNTSTVTVPNVGINVVTAGGTTATTYTVLNSIAQTAFGPFNFGPGLSNLTGVFQATRVLEFEINLTNNTIKMQYNGQSLFNSSSNETTGGLAIGNNIAGLAIFGSPLGTTMIEDIYLIDDSGSFANTWLGNNFAIHSPDLQSSGAGNGWTVVPADNGVYLNSADSDTSYVRTASIDAQIAFDLTTFSPSGNNPVVAGIRVDSVSRRLQLDAAYKYLYRNQSSETAYEMGDRIVLTGSTYTRKPAQFINVNPETGAQWTSAQINDNAFGLKSVDHA